MFQSKHAFSSFSVDDLQKAKQFYEETLGLQAEEDKDMGLLKLHVPGTAAEIMVYPKPEHTPASFTVLNLVVDDIGQAVDELSSHGVTFEKYGKDFKQDEKGIARSQSPEEGPDIAWFKDPAGNIFSVLQD